MARLLGKFAKLFRFQPASCYCCGQIIVGEKRIGEAKDFSRCIVCGQDVAPERWTKKYERIWRREYKRIQHTLRQP